MAPALRFHCRGSGCPAGAARAGRLPVRTDNTTDTLRLSTDSRYQRADAAVDERWIIGENGEAPVGHGAGAKRGKIC